MDDPNITMEEYIRLEEEKARRQGRTFNWQTATYGKMECFENKDNSFTNLEIEYPAIVFDDTSDATLSCEPTVIPLDNNEIDFKISFDKSDDEDYMVVFDENSFSYKIISVNNLTTDSEDENDKVNMPSSLSPEPTIGYIDDLDFFKYFENEFPAITYNDLKSKSNPPIKPSVNMAPLPPCEQRHPFLRYQGLEYSDQDIADFEERLERIHDRGTHRVQVLDFKGMPEIMRDVLYARMRMEHRDSDRVVMFTSEAWGRVFNTRGPLVREFILECLSMPRFGEVLLDLDAPGTIQFLLGGARRRLS
ncbi:hypothetical protein Tco_0980693 [Tanacetum coccineum]